jgi:hypothetical protein
MSLKEVAADVIALKGTSAIAASLLETLADKVAELTSKCIELEQRSSNFAARVSSHNACYRAEIQALRNEVAELRAGKKFTAPAVRISTALWEQAHAELCAKHPGKTYFPAAQVRAYASTIALAMTCVEPTPALHLSEEDEFAL